MKYAPTFGRLSSPVMGAPRRSKSAAHRAGGGWLGRRIDLGQQIHSDVYDALRTIEESELEDAPVERLLRVSSLAGELATALNDLFGRLPGGDGVSESDRASGARTPRNAGRSPSG